MNAASNTRTRTATQPVSWLREPVAPRSARTRLRAVTSRPEPCSATILFTDIVGFTPLTEQLGDGRALEVVRAHNAIVRERIRRFAGREIRFQGDGFMVAFHDTPHAVACAVSIQRALSNRAVWNNEHDLKIRIGINVGDTIRDGKELHGRSVIVAARIMAQARGGEILVSGYVKERVAAQGFAFDDGRETELKGLNGTHRVHGVVYDA